MNENLLKELSTQELLDLVITTMNEYSALIAEPENIGAIQEKQTEIYLLHKIINERKDQIKSLRGPD